MSNPIVLRPDKKRVTDAEDGTSTNHQGNPWWREFFREFFNKNKERMWKSSRVEWAHERHACTPSMMVVKNR